MRPEVVTEVTEDMLPRAALSAAHAAVWRAMLVRSYVAAPLVARGRVVGAIHLMMGESDRSFGQGDLPFLTDLANRAATAVENARLYRQAQEAVLAREEFLAIASHELRTPLTALQLGVQQLQGAPMSDSTEAILAPVLRRIERARRRLTGLAEDLLEVTRNKGGPLHLANLEDVDLRSVVENVIAEMQDDIARSGSNVSLDASGAAIGHWERRRLEQVVQNLLSNALKFGSRKAVIITVDAAAKNLVRLRVRDHGIGIPADEQSQIFDRFQRSPGAEHYGGFGLGLWIARQVVEALGGTIGVKSEPGEFTTFTVELPRTGPELPAADGVAQPHVAPLAHEEKRRPEKAHEEQRRPEKR